MINYFYNIVSKTDSCVFSTDVLTAVRKEFYLSREKQKGKLTQNSSGDCVYYEYSLEKDKVMKWLVSDNDNILSDCTTLDEGKYCIKFYDESGSFKVLTFSKYHTLLKVEYFNSVNATAPYCSIEPRKANNGLCLLLSGKSGFQPCILYAQPDVDDEYIVNKLESEFSDYSAYASTNEGDIRFLSEEQLQLFEEFVDRAAAMKLTENAPQSFIEESDAVLANKLNPKDFNIKRNLSEVVDLSQAECFSYDANDEILSELLSEDEPNESVVEQEMDTTPATEELEIDVDATLAAFLSGEDNPVIYVNKEKVDTPAVQVTEVTTVHSEDTQGTQDGDLEFEPAQIAEPDKVVSSGSADYMYYGELDSSNGRTGFGRTATVDGHTAYEGMYYDNKRNGTGAYYYKDGQLCYYGDWKNNKRDGFGIGVSSSDKSVHVGQFVDNKPQGDGVRVGDNGEVQFVRKTLTDGTTVHLTFDGDKILVKKYNKDGNLISENTSNLIYF